MRRVGRRMLAAVLAAIPVVAMSRPATRATAAGTAARYYFHAGATPLNQLDTLSGTPATFNGTKPTGSTPSLAGDTSVLTNTASAGIGDPTWTGTISGSIDTLKVDLFEKAVVGDAVGTVTYDVTAFVGDVAKFLGSFDPPADLASVNEVTHIFTSSDVDSPLPIDPAGQPVTISINGHYAD